jgi:acetate---CoA ligase (ADP-forming)
MSAKSAQVTFSFRSVFEPKSVVLIGASHQEGSVGNEIAENLATQGYKGKLFFVNPKGGKLFGRRVHKDLAQIKAPLDLAVIAIPAALVTNVIIQLAKLKVKAVVVISAGFKEIGRKNAEEDLARVCREHGITLVGPNCLGVISPIVKLNASFAPLMPELGSIAFVSQSGAICASVLDYARRRGLGFSKFISVGNKAAVTESELLDYLYHDHHTKVIAMYLEDVSDAAKLRKAALKVTHGNPHKPIIILKAGRTDQGQKASLSHTGSLGGSDQAYQALFTQAGIIRADSIDELFDFIECFARNKQLTRNKVAVITNAGGPGVLTADALIADGLELAKLSNRTQTRLRTFLPLAANVKNPVDILGDANAERYYKTLKTVLADEDVAAVQVVLTPQSMTEVLKTARGIVQLKKRTSKPLVVTFMGQGLVQPGVDVLNKNEVATSLFPESAAGSLAALYQFYDWWRVRRRRPTKFTDLQTAKVQKILNRYTSQGLKMLEMQDALAVLNAYGLPVVKHHVVRSEAEAAALAQHVKGNWALKIMSSNLSHKSDKGGVVLDVPAEELAAACRRLTAHIHRVAPAAAIDGIMVMPMIEEKGVEIILGLTTDPRLGKQIMVGLGGVYTEVYQDVSWGVVPISEADVERMIAHLKTAKILTGVRGQPPLAGDVLAECLGRLSQLAVDFPQIAELDINPLKVMAVSKGAIILDARIVLNTL